MQNIQYLDSNYYSGASHAINIKQDKSFLRFCHVGGYKPNRGFDKKNVIWTMIHRLLRLFEQTNKTYFYTTNFIKDTVHRVYYISVTSFLFYFVFLFWSNKNRATAQNCSSFQSRDKENSIRNKKEKQEVRSDWQ